MKKILLTVFLMTVQVLSYGQVKTSQGGLLSQEYSKEITEYKIKEFIARDILQLPDRKTIEVEISALTASKSGELTAIIYDCKELNKKGLIFGFWNEYSNEYSVNYNGYAFKNFDFEKAKDLLDNLEIVMENNKNILSSLSGNNEELTKNVMYKSDDLIFIFYKGGEIGSNLIRVLWNGFDSDWNQANLKTLKRRFYKFFVPK